jgi:hypothetical protein
MQGANQLPIPAFLAKETAALKNPPQRIAHSLFFRLLAPANTKHKNLLDCPGTIINTNSNHQTKE